MTSPFLAHTLIGTACGKGHSLYESSLFVLFLTFPSFLVLCVWVFCLQECLHTICMSGAHTGQKRAMGLLELELDGRPHPVGSGN